MSEHKTENYIGTLAGDVRNDAAGFFVFLLENGLQPERGQGYWADKLYWTVKYNGEYICFILINGVDDKTEHDGWVIWMGNSGASRLAEPISDERTKDVSKMFYSASHHINYHPRHLSDLYIYLGTSALKQ